MDLAHSRELATQAGFRQTHDGNKWEWWIRDSAPFQARIIRKSDGLWCSFEPHAAAEVERLIMYWWEQFTQIQPPHPFVKIHGHAIDKVGHNLAMADPNVWL